MKLEIMNPDSYREKTDNKRKESEKKFYVSPVLVCIKLDNEISLILNSNSPGVLPGDPSGPGCDNIDNSQLKDSPWE